MLDFIKQKIVGTHSKRQLKKFYRLLAEINNYKEYFNGYTQEQAVAKTAEFKERLEKGSSLDSLIPEAFSLVRYASTVTLGQTHYDVQILGGLALHFGDITEMKTGEGKTLTSTLAIYLNALLGKGVHVVTVNQYLAERDAEWMGQIFKYLGLSVGLIGQGQSDADKNLAYAADVTYGTNNEFGFDYLRDNMKFNEKELVQKNHYYAIVDEVDSILIDEARTPLIISGPAEASTENYIVVHRNILNLKRAWRKIENPDIALIAEFFKLSGDKLQEKLLELKDDTVVTSGHYTLDEKHKIIQLTEEGAELMEKRLAGLLREKSLYDLENLSMLHHINLALRANYILRHDIDYLVDNNQVKIVDEFTGRIMESRRFGDGLHQALEAKENVVVQRENQTLASITFQNYFRKYEKLAGMTGTAATEEGEFSKIYGLGVVIIPTNMPMVRKDNPDLIYKNNIVKQRSVIKKIRELQSKGQPVLVGTDSIESSEVFSKLLDKEKVAHSVLNAKNHAREAEIIANAGQKGVVTIATNMAGRGTDIQLGEEVIQLGGLFILGTARHESRRIDLQLRGRSGRQGDPGESQFFLALDDDLLRIFGGERISGLMSRLKIDENDAITHSMINRAIENAQIKVEENNFSIRKHLLEYDDVMNRQRDIVYQTRWEILSGDIETVFTEIINNARQNLMERFIFNVKYDEIDWEGLNTDFKLIFNTDLDIDQIKLKDAETADEYIKSIVKEVFEQKTESFGDFAKKIMQHISLITLDNTWKAHLVDIDRLKEAVGLRGYAQKNPLDEYKKEAFELFRLLMGNIYSRTAQGYFRSVLKNQANVPDNKEQALPSDIQLIHQSATAMARNNLQGQSSEGSVNKKIPLKRAQPKIGRNDPCFCGSGKKYKNCHGRLSG